MRFLPILVLHICGGILGLLSGTVAMSLRKGSRRHAVAGNVFVIAMLCMAASGSYLGFMKHQMNNVFGGILTIYLVTTAWATARRREGETGIFDWAGFLVALAIGALSVAHGLEKATGRIGSDDGVPAGMNIFMGSVILLAAAGDLRMLVCGSLSGTQRLVRHLWRMCFGLFIATGSFFIGQQQVFPAFIRKTNILFIPGILPLILMIFWLVRVRFANAYKIKSMPGRGDVYSPTDLALDPSFPQHTGGNSNRTRTRMST
jgi:uncharacterized membrane protein